MPHVSHWFRWFTISLTLSSVGQMLDCSSAIGAAVSPEVIGRSRGWQAGSPLVPLTKEDLGGSKANLEPFILAQKGLQDKLKDFNYWSDLCTLQADSGKYEDALASCEAAIVLRSKDPVIWADHSGVLLGMKKFPEAIASADKSLGFNPKTSLALTYKCMAFAALGRTEEALDQCTQALRVDGNWGKKSPVLAWLHRGLILNQQGELEQALIAFDRALLLEPSDAQIQAHRCEILSKLGQQEQAVAACDQALAGGDPASTSLAAVNRAKANGQLNQLGQAVADYDRAISANPTDPAIWAAQGLVLEQLSRFTEALTSYTQAVQLHPKSTRALIGQCTMLNVLGQYQKALEACDQAMQGDGTWRDTGIAQAWNQRSKALTGLGKYEEALASSKRATGIKPNYAEAWSDQAAVLWYLQQYNEAIAATQTAIRLNPGYAQAWFNQGTILRTLKRYPEALTAYQKGLQIDPTYADAWANQSVVLWHLQRYKASLEAANKAIQLNPKSLAGWYNQGVALMELGRYTDALMAFERVLVLNPSSAEALTGRGLALSQLKKYPEAIAALQASLKLNPKQPFVQKTLETLLKQPPKAPAKPS